MAKRKKTFQEAVSEIDEILAKIENEELDLDEISENVKKLASLLAMCKSKIKTTEEEIGKILDEMEE